MKRSINWFILAVAVIFITSLQTATSAPGQDEEITRHLNSFLVDYSEAFGIVRERFGDDREKIPKYLIEIMDDVIGRNSEIVTEQRRLRSEVSDIEYDQYRLDNDEKDLDSKEDNFWQEKAELMLRVSRWEADLQIHENEFSAHQAAERLIRTEEGRRRWRQEADRIEARASRLANRQAQLQREVIDFGKREKDLGKKRQSFRERRDTSTKRIRQLNRDIDNFRRQCVAASHWSIVLAEMASVWSESGRDAGSGRIGSKFYEEIANIVGPTAIAQLGFKTLGGGVGHVLTALDIATAVSNEHEREIQRRLLIIGNYAEAIKSLKSRGHLRQGDRRYEALRYMMQMSGRSMPTSATEFNIQALGTAKALGNSLAAVASHYMGGALAKSGKAKVISAFKADRRFWASNGLLRSVVKGANDILGNMVATINIRTSTSHITQLRERAGERRR